MVSKYFKFRRQMNIRFIICLLITKQRFPWYAKVRQIHLDEPIITFQLTQEAVPLNCWDWPTNAEE